MTNLAFGTSATTLLAIAYAYDADDRRTSERWSTDRAMGYAYNALNQLASGTWSGSLTAVGEANYAQGAVTVNNVAAQLYPDRTFETASIPVADGTNTLAAIYHGPAFTNTQTVATNVVTAILADTAFAHDALGRRTLARTGGDAHASGTRWHYDPATGRLAWQEDLAGNRTTFGYDPATGRRTSVTDALTNVVHTAYDLQGRVTNTWGATYPVGYEYDAFGRMVAMQTWRDENVAPDITRWNYDPATGLLTNKVYADGLGPAYEYDPAGRLARRTWARGVETAYTYDALGQLAAIDYSDATPDIAYTYDRLGRQLTITDVLGIRTNFYSPTSLLEERHPDGTALVRSYDTFGRPAGIALGPDYAVGYAYDEYGRFSTVTVSNGPTFGYSYVSCSPLLSGYTNDLGLAVAYEYEPLRDLKTLVSNAWSTNVISTFAYDYDAIGRRRRRIDDSTTTNLFGYNLRSELVSAEMGTNTYSYAYDPIGNRTESVENGLTTTYAANELNQYTTLNPASTNPTPFTYDPDGNMTSDGTWSYSWDAENRLIEVQPLVTNLDSTLVQYMYDAQSRRIARREFSWMAFLHDDPTWRYVQGRAYRYDGWNLLQELKPSVTPRTPPTYMPQTDLRLTGTAGSTAARYVWGLDLSQSLQGAGGIGGLLQTCRGATNAFSFYDGNGNTTAMADDDGIILDSYAYDSFGNEFGAQPFTLGINPFHFSTKIQDGVIDMCYYGYRYGSAWLGRWLSRDLIGENGGDNVYLFSWNNAINHVDMVGLASCCRCISAQISDGVWVLQSPSPWPEYESLREWKIPTYRIGMDIQYSFETEGEMKNCEFFQKEEGYIYRADFAGKHPKWKEFDGKQQSIRDNLFEDGTMTDLSGISFSHPYGESVYGDYILTYNLLISIECIGTDGSQASDSRWITGQRAYTVSPLFVYWKVY